MRAEEILASEALINYLGEAVTDVVKGEDPPDLYAVTKKGNIPIEVTLLYPSTVGPMGEVESRKSEDYPILGICDSLNSKFGNLLQPQTSLVLDITGPIKNLGKFNRSLNRIIKKLLEENEDIQKSHEENIEVEGNHIKLLVFPRNGKAIKCNVRNVRASNDLIYNAKRILENRISKKQISMREWFPAGPVWLALVDNDFLLEFEYHLAYPQLEITHEFERIFLIRENGDVEEFEP